MQTTLAGQERPGATAAQGAAPRLDDERLAGDAAHVERLEQLACGKHGAAPGRGLAPVGAVQVHRLQAGARLRREGTLVGGVSKRRVRARMKEQVHSSLASSEHRLAEQQPHTVMALGVNCL